MKLPVWAQQLTDGARRRPYITVAAVVLVGGLVYWDYQNPTKAQTPEQSKPPRPAAGVQGIDTQRAHMERVLLDVQKSNAKLHETLVAQQQTISALEQAAQHRETMLADKLRQQESRMEGILRSAQATAAKARPPARPAAPPRRQPSPPPPPAPVVAAQAQAQRPSADVGRVRFLSNPPGESTVKIPTVTPPIERQTTAFLPPGSYGEGRIITGVFAAAQANGALPVLLALRGPFYGPHKLQGPGLGTRPTAVPIEGCLLLGKASAELVSQRVHVQLDQLSCVFPDESTFNREVKGYVVGKDGSLGVPGRLERRDGAYVAGAVLASAMRGMSEAFQASKRTVSITPFGGAIASQGGNIAELAGFGALGRASEKLADRYLNYAERLLPVLWVESGVDVNFVLQDGLSLEGFPLVSVLWQGSAQR